MAGDRHGRLEPGGIIDGIEVLPATPTLRRLRRDLAGHRMRRRAIARMTPGETRRDLARQEARVEAMLFARLTRRPPDR